MTREEARRRVANTTMAIAQEYYSPWELAGGAPGGVMARANLYRVTAERKARYDRANAALAPRGISLADLDAAYQQPLTVSRHRPRNQQQPSQADQIREGLHRGILAAFVQREVVCTLARHQARAVLRATGRL